MASIVRAIMSYLYWATRFWRELATWVRLACWKLGVARICSTLSTPWSRRSYELGSRLIGNRYFDIATFHRVRCSTMVACQIRCADKTWANQRLYCSQRCPYLCWSYTRLWVNYSSRGALIKRISFMSSFNVASFRLNSSRNRCWPLCTNERTATDKLFTAWLVYSLGFSNNGSGCCKCSFNFITGPSNFFWIVCCRFRMFSSVLQ